MSPLPSDSVEWRVVQSVVQALEAVCHADGDYYTDPLRVYRMYGNVMELMERPCFVVTPIESPHSHDCPNGMERVDLKLSVTCVMDEFTAPDGDHAPIEEAIRNMATDAKKALLQDLKRGGLAIDTILESTYVLELVAGTDVAAAEVVVNIPFRHLTADPTQAA
jgi:hypothetical protein